MKEKENLILSETEKALYKEINLFQKKTFRTFLIDAITSENKENFDKIVGIIGVQWGVKRTVSNKQTDTELDEQETECLKVTEKGFERFTTHLWNKKLDILKGTYNEWYESDFKAYSYESKICFLLNPSHYKIIFDEHNKRATDFKSANKNDWQGHVEKYYKEHFGDNPNFCIEEYFLNDCNLWLKGWF